MGYGRDDIISVYIATFAARTDAYSHWTPDGWRPVRSPLTPAVVIAGLTGTGPSISGYMIAPGDTTHVFAVDFDTDDGLEQALTLGRGMWSNDIPCYVETSRRGAHLWCSMDGSLPAKKVRYAIRALCLDAGLPDDDPKIELRPGSDTIEWEGLGHCIRMPLMPHPKTGKRGAFMYPTGTSLPGAVGDVMLAIDLVTTGQIEVWASLWTPTLKPADIPREYRNPRPPYNNDLGTASSILQSLWGVLDARPGKAVRCPAHEDKVPSLSIFKDDERVLCFSPSCVLHNGGHGRGTFELTKMAPHV